MIFGLGERWKGTIRRRLLTLAGSTLTLMVYIYDLTYAVYKGLAYCWRLRKFSPRPTVSPVILYVVFLRIAPMVRNTMFIYLESNFAIS